MTHLPTMVEPPQLACVAESAAVPGAGPLGAAVRQELSAPPLYVSRAFLSELLNHCQRMAKLAGADSSYRPGAKIAERVNIKRMIRDESEAAAALIGKVLAQ